MPVSCLGEPSPLAPKEATGGAVLFSVSYVTKAATSVSAAAYWRLICSGTPIGGVQWPEAAPLAVHGRGARHRAARTGVGRDSGVCE